jgi:hypothetical protein
VGARALALRETFADQPATHIALAEITLEYDLAKAADANPLLMAEVWERGFVGMPKTFSVSKLSGVTSLEEKALLAWRGICRASPSRGKADFAHLLADELANKPCEGFDVPPYLKGAIQHVKERV